MKIVEVVVSIVIDYYFIFYVIVIDYVNKNLEVIVIVIEYFEKNLDAINYVKLAFKRGNPICDVMSCHVYSDKSVVLNLLAHRPFF